jgi:hypothetical protein
MPFQGGALSTIGIPRAVITQTLTQAANVGVQQVFQGSGQSFFGSAGQALAGNQAGSIVNIALNSALGTQVLGPAGLSLDSGANILATQITPFVTGAVAAGINQSIGQALQSAGDFGPILSTASSTLVNELFNGATNAIFGSTTADPGVSTKMFPGAGQEPPADYSGGTAYTLGSNGSDVIFSLQPANKGPQNFGLSQAINTPPTSTTSPFDSFVSSAVSAPNATADAVKFAAMNNNFTSAPFKSNFASNLPLF